MPITLSTKVINNIKSVDGSAFKERFPVALSSVAFIPVIDYFNKDVDEETRKYTALKSLVKLSIGMVDGLTARIVGQKIGEWLVREGKIKPLTEAIAKNPDLMKSFGPSVGKASAVIATLISIVAMDVPFMDKALNYTMKKLFPNVSKKND